MMDANGANEADEARTPLVEGSPPEGGWESESETLLDSFPHKMTPVAAARRTEDHRQAKQREKDNAGSDGSARASAVPTPNSGRPNTGESAVGGSSRPQTSSSTTRGTTAAASASSGSSPSPLALGTAISSILSPNLTTLILSDCGLQDEDLDLAFAKRSGAECLLPHLYYLDLSSNQLQSFPTFLFGRNNSNSGGGAAADHGAAIRCRGAPVRRVVPTPWMINASNNRSMRLLPALVLEVPVLGYVNLSGCLGLSPAVTVAGLKGLVCAEVYVPEATDVSAVVESMLGVLAVNGTLCVLREQPPQHSKKCESHHTQLRRRYSTAAPSPAVLLLQNLHSCLRLAVGWRHVDHPRLIDKYELQYLTAVRTYLADSLSCRFQWIRSAKSAGVVAAQTSSDGTVGARGSLTVESCALGEVVKRIRCSSLMVQVSSASAISVGVGRAGAVCSGAEPSGGSAPDSPPHKSSTAASSSGALVVAVTCNPPLLWDRWVTLLDAACRDQSGAELRPIVVAVAALVCSAHSPSLLPYPVAATAVNTALEDCITQIQEVDEETDRLHQALLQILGTCQVWPHFVQQWFVEHLGGYPSLTAALPWLRPHTDGQGSSGANAAVGEDDRLWLLHTESYPLEAVVRLVDAGLRRNCTDEEVQEALQQTAELRRLARQRESSVTRAHSERAERQRSEKEHRDDADERKRTRTQMLARSQNRSSCRGEYSFVSGSLLSSEIVVVPVESHHQHQQQHPSPTSPWRMLRDESPPNAEHLPAEQSMLVSQDPQELSPIHRNYLPCRTPPMVVLQHHANSASRGHRQQPEQAKEAKTGSLSSLSVTRHGSYTIRPPSPASSSSWPLVNPAASASPADVSSRALHGANTNTVRVGYHPQATPPSPIASAPSGSHSSPEAANTSTTAVAEAQPLFMSRTRHCTRESSSRSGSRAAAQLSTCVHPRVQEIDVSCIRVEDEDGAVDVSTASWAIGVTVTDAEVSGTSSPVKAATLSRSSATPSRHLSSSGYLALTPAYRGLPRANSAMGAYMKQLADGRSCLRAVTPSDMASAAVSRRREPTSVDVPERRPARQRVPGSLIEFLRRKGQLHLQGPVIRAAIQHATDFDVVASVVQPHEATTMVTTSRSDADHGATAVVAPLRNDAPCGLMLATPSGAPTLHDGAETSSHDGHEKRSCRQVNRSSPHRQKRKGGGDGGEPSNLVVDYVSVGCTPEEWRKAMTLLLGTYSAPPPSSSVDAPKIFTEEDDLQQLQCVLSLLYLLTPPDGRRAGEVYSAFTALVCVTCAEHRVSLRAATPLQIADMALRCMTQRGTIHDESELIVSAFLERFGEDAVVEGAARQSSASPGPMPAPDERRSSNGGPDDDAPLGTVVSARDVSAIAAPAAVATLTSDGSAIVSQSMADVRQEDTLIRHLKRLSSRGGGGDAVGTTSSGAATPTTPSLLLYSGSIHPFTVEAQATLERQRAISRVKAMATPPVDRAEEETRKRSCSASLRPLRETRLVPVGRKREDFIPSHHQFIPLAVREHLSALK